MASSVQGRPVRKSTTSWDANPSQLRRVGGQGDGCAISDHHSSLAVGPLQGSDPNCTLHDQERSPEPPPAGASNVQARPLIRSIDCPIQCLTGHYNPERAVIEVYE